MFNNILMADAWALSYGHQETAIKPSDMVKTHKHSYYSLYCLSLYERLKHYNEPNLINSNADLKLITTTGKFCR